jgi:adenylate kinase family enzyme
MTRIIVVGAPGMGKTTFTMEYARQHGIARIATDPVLNGIPDQYLERRKIYEATIQEPAWVMDGLHIISADQALALCDRVIICRLGLGTNLGRIVKRRCGARNPSAKERRNIPLWYEIYILCHWYLARRKNIIWLAKAHGKNVEYRQM